MARRTQKYNPAQMSFFENFGNTGYAVPAITHAVGEWRANDYHGATDTSRTLLNYWFRNDHKLPTGDKFEYYLAQRVAIETLIYVFEVAKSRRRLDLYTRFIPAEFRRQIRWPDPDTDHFARYCTKMATGTGKTKVMKLALAWQYFNAVIERSADYATTFLLIAPNVIVFERLRGDFQDDRSFRQDPVIPKEFELFWDMQYYMRGDAERASSEGALYLTNIQQLYERENKHGLKEPAIMTAVLGNPPPADIHGEVDFHDRILERDGSPVLVINDEAHHTHDSDSVWNKTIRSLHSQHLTGLAAQLDFTATPRYDSGAPFEWTISDYPLKQAIMHGIVKRPIKGITDISQVPSDVAQIQYEPFIVAGVERWREYRDQLKKTGKRPLLFIMMNKTAEADSIGDYLRVAYPEEFGAEKTLVIHTDRKGEVSKRDLEVARKAAKEVDRNESRINAIVSVLMLREGWDVQNVTVIVGLRPYTSQANILPEQTIGRGLRLMFRDKSYDEHVDIIGNPGFIDFIEKLEQEEDYQFDTWRVGKDKLEITTIEPVPEKAEFDVALPTLSPIIVRSKSLQDEIEALDILSLYDGEPLPMEPLENEERTFTYRGKDLITSEQLFERIYAIPIPQTSQEIVAYYTNRIAKELRMPSQFAHLAPKVRDFLQYKAFGQEVDLDRPEIRAALSQKLHQILTMKVFLDALREKIVQPQEPVLESGGRYLSEVSPFAWSQPAPVCRKTIFNKVPCENSFEEAFARFLDNASDVLLFGKLPDKFGFSIPYPDSRGNLRQYYPDFVVVGTDAIYHLVETKGREDIDVGKKDQAARAWAHAATNLTGTEWHYLKVLQKDFEGHTPNTFAACAQMAMLQVTASD